MHGGWLSACGALLLLAGCQSDVFFCQQNGDCLDNRTEGTCQVNGLCSFPDGECPSGQRYGGAGGSLAGQCVQPTTGTGGTTSSDASTGDSLASTAAPESTSTQDTSAETTATETESTTLPLTTTDPDTGETTTSTGIDTNPDGAPLGTTCMDGPECQSGICANDICGECSNDADCEHGCTRFSPYFPGFDYGRCNDGLQGDACESVAACVDSAACVPFLGFGGNLPFATCSDCGGDDECPDGTTCGIQIDEDFQRGGHLCLPVASQLASTWCSTASSQCMGFCADLELADGPVGVCGQCLTDADCTGAAPTCTPPFVNFDDLSPVGSVCT